MDTTTTTNNAGGQLLVGMFRNKDNAEQAYDDLKDCGYTSEEINVVMANDTRDKYYGDEDKEHTSEMGNKAMEGAGTGGAIGGVLGGIAGAIAAIGTNLLLPGLGLLVLGPLAAGLAGAGAGGLAGGIIGALVGAGIPKDKAEIYHEGLKDGKILISVHTHSAEDTTKLSTKWHEYQVDDIHS